MKIKGSNVATINKNGCTKDLQLSHHGANIELKTTENGIAIVCGLNTAIKKNGNTLVAVRTDTDTYFYGDTIIQNGVY